MRNFTFFLLISVLITASCTSLKKNTRNSKKQDSESSAQGTSSKKTLMPASPIKEVEEKLVSNEDKAPGPERYFVVIGSFKDPANAKEHQSIVRKDGFESEVLKNEAGLYRVSVMATDDITAARNEVKRIWSKFPKYSDTWMLIRKDQ
jgi:cell division protein FtsN